jgi:prepilin signal peptidase PulO-like enzyme (type II secretory pathway)
VVFLFSLLVGSFLNVVIHRVPIMLEREWHSQAEEILRERQADVGLKPDLQRTPSSAQEKFQRWLQRRLQRIEAGNPQAL